MFRPTLARRMVHMGTILDVVDNSGARRLRVIKTLGGRQRRAGGIGDIVVASVQETRHADGKVKKGDVKKALIVRTKKGIARPNGHRIKFLQNAAVVLNENKDPAFTRVFGPVCSELRELGFAKVLSLAKTIV